MSLIARMPAEPHSSVPEPGAFRPSRGVAAWTPYLMALLIVAAATGVAELLYEALDVRRLSAVFLAAILIVATRFGSRPALIAAAAAFVAYNVYTVEPRFTFRIDTLSEVLNLTIFLLVALLTGRLAGRVQEEKVRANARAREMSTLFSASRQFSAMVGEGQVRQALANEIARAVDGTAEVIWEGATWTATTEPADPAAGGRWVTQELLVANEHLGVARWRTRPERRPSAGEQDEAIVRAIVDLGASAIARSRAVASAPLVPNGRTEPSAGRARRAGTSRAKLSHGAGRSH